MEIGQWKGRRVLVTGATGFVGSRLAERLIRHEAEVFAYVKPSTENPTGYSESQWLSSAHILRGRVEDYQFLKRILYSQEIDTIFHLAAININTGANVSPFKLFEVNIRGVYSVLEAARVSGCVKRIVVASSQEAQISRSLSERPNVIQTKQHPYQVSKVAAELIAKAYHDFSGLPVVVARCSNIYGGRDLNWNRLVPGTIKSVLNGRPPVIRSDGTLKRDYLYVEDVVSAYLCLCNRADHEAISGEVFHFGSGEYVSVLDLVKKVMSIANRPELQPIVLNESRGERIDDNKSYERERDVLGWASEVDLETGLRWTFDWYATYFSQHSHTGDK